MSASISEAEVDWLGEPVAAVSVRPPVIEKPRVQRAPKPTRSIAPADAWLLFRTTTAPGEPDGPRDHVEDLRVVSGNDLNARMRRSLAGESKDYDWDVPLMRTRIGPDDEWAKTVLRCRGDPETDPQAAFWFFCLHWRFADKDQVFEAFGRIAGLEWVHSQWLRGKS